MKLPESHYQLAKMIVDQSKDDDSVPKAVKPEKYPGRLLNEVDHPFGVSLGVTVPSQQHFR
jgi:hypothetical protein